MAECKHALEEAAAGLQKTGYDLVGAAESITAMKDDDNFTGLTCLPDSVDPREHQEKYDLARQNREFRRAFRQRDLLKQMAGNAFEKRTRPEKISFLDLLCERGIRYEDFTSCLGKLDVSELFIEGCTRYAGFSQRSRGWLIRSHGSHS